MIVGSQRGPKLSIQQPLCTLQKMRNQSSQKSPVFQDKNYDDIKIRDKSGTLLGDARIPTQSAVLTSFQTFPNLTASEMKDLKEACVTVTAGGSQGANMEESCYNIVDSEGGSSQGVNGSNSHSSQKNGKKKQFMIQEEKQVHLNYEFKRDVIKEPSDLKINNNDSNDQRNEGIINSQVIHFLQAKARSHQISLQIHEQDQCKEQFSVSKDHSQAHFPAYNLPRQASLSQSKLSSNQQVSSIHTPNVEGINRQQSLVNFNQLVTPNSFQPTSLHSLGSLKTILKKEKSCLSKSESTSTLIDNSAQNLSAPLDQAIDQPRKKSGKVQFNKEREVLNYEEHLQEKKSQSLYEDVMFESEENEEQEYCNQDLKERYLQMIDQQTKVQQPENILLKQSQNFMRTHITVLEQVKTEKVRDENLQTIQEEIVPIYERNQEIENNNTKENHNNEKEYNNKYIRDAKQSIQLTEVQFKVNQDQQDSIFYSNTYIPSTISNVDEKQIQLKMNEQEDETSGRIRVNSLISQRCLAKKQRLPKLFGLPVLDLEEILSQGEGDDKAEDFPFQDNQQEPNIFANIHKQQIEFQVLSSEVNQNISQNFQNHNFSQENIPKKKILSQNKAVIHQSINNIHYQISPNPSNEGPIGSKDNCEYSEQDQINQIMQKIQITQKNSQPKKEIVKKKSTLTCSFCNIFQLIWKSN